MNAYFAKINNELHCMKLVNPVCYKGKVIRSFWQARGYLLRCRASEPFGQYQIILLDYRTVHV